MNKLTRRGFIKLMGMGAGTRVSGRYDSSQRRAPRGAGCQSQRISLAFVERLKLTHL